MALERLDAAGFRSEVDNLLTRTCGVSYSDLVEMAPRMAIERTAQHSRPVEFAVDFANRHALRRVADMPGSGDAAKADAARAINERIAAITEFAKADPWKLDGKGGAYFDMNGERVTLNVYSEHGRYGFGVCRPERGEAPITKLDIQEAVGGMVMRIRNEQSIANAPVVEESEPNRLAAAR